jgi:hypothetical protein
MQALQPTHQQYTSEELHRFYDNHPNPAVSYTRFCQRMKTKGWSIDRAITSQVRHNPSRTLECMQFYEKTPEKDRKVSYDRFYGRVVSGWDFKRALLTPLMGDTQECHRYYNEYKGPKVEFSVFYARAIRQGWSWERAISQSFVPRGNGKLWCPERVFYETNRARAKVGLSVFMTRVRSLKWNLETALTKEKLTKATRQGTHRKYFNEHPDPQVGYNTYIGRILTLGWTPEQAISTPPNATKQPETTKPFPTPRTKGTLRRRVSQEALKYYESHRDNAQVPLKTYVHRILIDCWDMQRALETPIAGRSAVQGPALQSVFFQMCASQPA